MAWLRTLLIVLILLNVLAFAGLQGWLGSSVPQGEPERITNQLNPERIKLRPLAKPKKNDAASPAKPAPPPASTVSAPPAAPPAPEPAAAAAPEQACLALGGLAPEAARRFGEEAAARPGLQVKDVQVEAPTSWWVNLPPAGSKEAAEGRVAELRQQGVSDFFIMQEAGPNQFAISLGLFKQAAQAERLAEQLKAKGVGEVRVSPRGAVHRVELRGPAGRVPEVLGELAPHYAGASRQACPP